MTKKNVTEAKAELSRLLVLVENGEEVVIMRGDKPVAKLVAYEGVTLPRKFGLMKGEVWISEDFDDPCPEIEEMFYGGSIEPEELVEDAS